MSFAIVASLCVLVSGLLSAIFFSRQPLIFNLPLPSNPWSPWAAESPPRIQRGHWQPEWQPELGPASAPAPGALPGSGFHRGWTVRRRLTAFTWRGNLSELLPTLYRGTSYLRDQNWNCNHESIRHGRVMLCARLKRRSSPTSRPSCTVLLLSALHQNDGFSFLKKQTSHIQLTRALVLSILAKAQESIKTGSDELPVVTLATALAAFQAVTLVVTPAVTIAVALVVTLFISGTLGNHIIAVPRPAEVGTS